MPFNSMSYYANKYERQARAHLKLARDCKGRGDSARVAEYVKLARGLWRLARMHRACA